MKKETIHNIKDSGFKTPDNYFESFETQLLERISEKEMINTSGDSGFTVPKGYFDSVENNVLKQLTCAELVSVTKPETHVIALKSRRTFYYVAGIAASFVLLISLVFNTNDDKLSIDTIDTASIESYLYQEDYSNEDLASLFKTDDISETNFIDVNITDDTLNEYLEHIDTEDLILD